MSEFCVCVLPLSCTLTLQFPSSFKYNKILEDFKGIYVYWSSVDRLDFETYDFRGMLVILVVSTFLLSHHFFCVLFFLICAKLIMLLLPGFSKISMFMDVIFTSIYTRERKKSKPLFPSKSYIRGHGLDTYFNIYL